MEGSSVTLTELLEELWAHLEERFFSPDLGSYDYVNFGSGTMINLQNIVFGILIGMLIASFMTIFDKRVLGDFVRHVLSHECFSHESAKTLYELGYYKNSIIRGSLKHSVSLRRVVKCVEEEEFNEKVKAMREEYDATVRQNDKKALPFKEPKFEMDTSTMHFYIPERMKYMAEIKFDRKGANWKGILIALIVTIVAAFFLFYFLPDMLQFVDNIIGIMDEKNNIVT